MGVGIHNDYPIEYYEPDLEGVICIARDDFDVEHIFQGYLCYPEADFDIIYEHNFDF